MSFNSLIFILFFLPLILFLYYIIKDKYKNLVLLLGSIVFYSFSSTKTLLIIFISILVNYFIGITINKSKYKKHILFIGVLFNILILIYYKYVNFFVSSFNNFLGQYINIKFSPLSLLIPLGLSYITFQQISYIVDIYRDSETNINFLDYCLYILFFPKIISGPIIQFKDVKSNFKFREYTDDSMNDGIYRFAIGLGKKIIIASTLQNVVDKIFALDPNTLPMSLAWLGIIAYTMQIYFDFSGYTDMAIGIAEMFCFNLPENFNKPYLSKSIGEFWRRWHITLSNFLRDYIYIPLGGNKVSRSRMLINTMIVFSLSGLWHGANFTFIIWGFYHGFCVIIEKLGFKKFLNKLPNALSQTITFIIVSIGWVFFRSDNVKYAVKYIKTLFNPFAINRVLDTSFLGLDKKFFLILLIALLITLIPKIKIIKSDINTFANKCFSLIILVYSIAIVTTGSFKPFIYFKF